MAEQTIANILQQAIADHQAGKLREAEEGYRKVLEREPANVDALHLLGVLAGMQGNLQSAVQLIGQAAALAPKNFDILCNSGNALRQTGQIRRAADCYLAAALLRPGDVESLLHAAALLLQLREPQRALEVLQRASIIAPQRADIHREMGIALHQLQRHHEAIDECQKALAITPDDVQALAHLAQSLRHVNRHEQALASWQKILQLGEAVPPEYRALALENLDRWDEALVEYRNAVANNPSAPLLYHNLGSLLQQQGHADEALQFFEKALSIAPQIPILHLDRAMVLLLKGNFSEGWKEYDWRWQCPEQQAPRRSLPQPLWRDQDVSGKTLLLYAEQGLGDSIQFMRYAPKVKQLGAKIVLEVHPDLVALTRTLEGVDQVIAAGISPSPQFDLHAPLMDLPLILGTTLQSIPTNVPYLKADEMKVRTWSARLASDEPSGRPRLRVGLVWAGKSTHAFNRNRSIPLAQFAPLTMCGDRVSFVSLQREPPAGWLSEPPPGLMIRDYSQDLHDLSDRAALLENLDLLISVDTSVAHLAGALGRPAWVLLSTGADWRWLEDREDSPWYPTLRLFRQKQPCDWSATIQQVADELCKRAPE